MKRLLIASVIVPLLAIPVFAGNDWAKECSSFGLTPGTSGFKSCVEKMSDADRVAHSGSASESQVKRGSTQSQQAAPQNRPSRENAIFGTWSAGSPQSGVAFAFNQDGTYTNVSGGGGAIQKLWGRYHVMQTSTTGVRIDFQLMGWLPRRLCAQVVGGARVCRPYKPMYSNSATVSMTSPSSFDAGGTSFRRDPSPYFLQIKVPEILERQTANTSGYIRQPVMPTLHPYQTPGGAGSVGAMRYDDQHQQPYRTCAVNNGSVYTTQDGVQHCSN